MAVILCVCVSSLTNIHRQTSQKDSNTNKLFLHSSSPPLPSFPLFFYRYSVSPFPLYSPPPTQIRSLEIGHCHRRSLRLVTDNTASPFSVCKLSPLNVILSPSLTRTGHPPLIPPYKVTLSSLLPFYPLYMTLTSHPLSHLPNSSSHLFLLYSNIFHHSL